jgi:hypothetical protein
MSARNLMAPMKLRQSHPSAGSLNTAIPMLHLFVPPTSFDGWGEHSSDRTTIRELLASLLVIVSLGAVALTICIALGLILSDGPLELTHPNRFPIPACLIISFAVKRARGTVDVVRVISAYIVKRSAAPMAYHFSAPRSKFLIPWTPLAGGGGLWGSSSPQQPPNG